MQNQLKAPRGTNDVLGKDSYKWQYVEQTAAKTAQAFGCRETRFPTFEETELFARGVGDTTDIVQKEMYTFDDKGGRSMTLRPEGTASVVRQCTEHGLWGGLLPLKLYYIISAFRYEKPQAGRFREFHQFGIEYFGPQQPEADVEIIKLGNTFLQNLGIQAKLTVNSIGCPGCRAEYQKALKAYFEARKEDLCPTCLGRLERNPMRILDCKSPVCRQIAAGAPLITDYLCEECAQHYKAVQQKLDGAQIAYEKDPHIVRGLDYYTKTVFEFLDPDSGLALVAGGRYDGLVREIDGKADICGLGFASGIERLIGVMERKGLSFGDEKKPDFFFASVGEEGAKCAERLADALRAKGFWVETDLMARSLKAQMKYAGKLEVAYCAVLGDEEAQTQNCTLKNMKDGTQRSISFEELGNLT